MRTEKEAVLIRSSNPKTVRFRDEDEPDTGRARASNTESGALVCCCACRNRTTQTRPKQCKHKGARQATRHTKGAETNDKTNSAAVLAGSRKAIVQSTSRVEHRTRADKRTTRGTRVGREKREKRVGEREGRVCGMGKEQQRGGDVSGVLLEHIVILERSPGRVLER